MTKNDMFYKILFAIELALLPLVIFASIRIEEKWAICLFIGAVLLVKIWLELFKDKYDYQHAIISSISSILTFGVLLILFACNGYINMALAIVTVVLIAIYNILYVVQYKAQLPEFVQAVDFCYMLFECIAIACFVLVAYYNIASLIAIFALILTTVVSAGYKIYNIVRTLLNKNMH